MRYVVGALCAASLVFLNAPVSADEVRLRNGDRVTGETTKLENGTLTFKTGFGELGIAWQDVEALIVDETIEIETTEGDTVVHPGGAIDVPRTRALKRPDPGLTVTGGANAGFLQTGGNSDVNSLRLDGRMIARMAANRYTVEGSVNRAEDRGVETTRNWTTSARYDRFLTSRLFLNANGIFTHDRFRDLDLRTALGAGLGYQFADSRRMQLSADGGLGWVNESLAGQVDNRYTALREAAKLDLFIVGERVVLFHQHDGYFGVTGDDNRFVKTQNGVRFGLVGGLVTTAQIDLDYDASPSPGRRNVDRALALTFGYRF